MGGGEKEKRSELVDHDERMRMQIEKAVHQSLIEEGAFSCDMDEVRKHSLEDEKQKKEVVDERKIPARSF